MTALILAFIFRAFFIEAFIIPTGSMAETLLGEHGTYCCPNCGWEFDFGPAIGAPSSQLFGDGLTVRCPNCHTAADLDAAQIVPKSGDRILVHKWPFVVGGWLGPRRWDVIVFRDPADPSTNFIKRLIALPGESIEIIDGDIYIKGSGDADFHIARKTPAAQRVLWFNVFDQQHPPIEGTPAARARWVPSDDAGNGDDGDGWSGLDTRVFRYQATDATPRAIRFAPLGSTLYLEDLYGYNRGPSGGDGSSPPYVGDVRLVGELAFDSDSGAARWEIDRDGWLFALEIHASGAARLTMRPPAGGQQLLAETAHVIQPGAPTRIEFGHVDYRVFANVGGVKLASTDDQYGPDIPRLRGTQRVRPLELSIAATGSLQLRGLRIDRDVHYLGSRRSTLRAGAGDAFALRDGEYFVLGDNSPNSHDSREWDRVGPHLRDEPGYRTGTVPESQIVGRAFFVYLPGLLPLDERGRWRIPDLGRVRFVR